MKAKGRKASQQKEPQAVYVRNTPELQDLGLVSRIKDLAARGSVTEAAVARGLLLLGLAQAEGDPGLLFRAAELARKAA